MFEHSFKQEDKYKSIMIEESKKLLPKESKKRCLCLNISKKKDQDISFEKYQMDATIYNGKYMQTYEQWKNEIIKSN